MTIDFWYSEAEKREQDAKWKKDLKSIGEDVYSFFIDKLKERGFEDREGQWDMSCEITDAMKQQQHIVVEAGVGIGKTFAYIVPLLYYHKKYKKPIIYIVHNRLVFNNENQSVFYCPNSDERKWFYE